jgi:hypothetical protein
MTNLAKSYCNYTAYGETGDDPSIDPVYPDPQPGGYQGKPTFRLVGFQNSLMQETFNVVFTNPPTSSVPRMAKPKLIFP